MALDAASGDTPAVKIGRWLSRSAWAAAAAIKNAVVSDRPRYVTVRFGPARGGVLHTIYRSGSRMIFGLYESEVAPYLRRYVHSGDRCYDIGAADGYYALAFARLAAPGRVYCFDIDDQSTQELRALATHNAHLGSAISAHRLRIGAVPIDDTQTSLDALVYEQAWQRPNVIKLDVESDELNVLHGAERLLMECHPRLIIEVHSMTLEAECQGFLNNLGYTTTVVGARTVMAEDAFRIGFNRWLCAE